MDRYDQWKLSGPKETYLPDEYYELLDMVPMYTFFEEDWQTDRCMECGKTGHWQELEEFLIDKDNPKEALCPECHTGELSRVKAIYGVDD